MADDDVKVLPIPFGSIIAVRGAYDAPSQESLATELRRVIEHDRWVLVFLSPGEDATLLGNDEIIAALRATMADEVDADVISRAEIAAGQKANEVAQVVVSEAMEAAAETIREAKRAESEAADNRPVAARKGK